MNLSNQEKEEFAVLRGIAFHKWAEGLGEVIFTCHPDEVTEIRVLKQDDEYSILRAWVFYKRKEGIPSWEWKVNLSVDLERGDVIEAFQVMGRVIP